MATVRVHRGSVSTSLASAHGNLSASSGLGNDPLSHAPLDHEGVFATMQAFRLQHHGELARRLPSAARSQR